MIEGVCVLVSDILFAPELKHLVEEKWWLLNSKLWLVRQGICVVQIIGTVLDFYYNRCTTVIHARVVPLGFLVNTE